MYTWACLTIYRHLINNLKESTLLTRSPSMTILLSFTLYFTLLISFSLAGLHCEPAHQSIMSNLDLNQRNNDFAVAYTCKIINHLYSNNKPIIFWDWQKTTVIYTYLSTKATLLHINQWQLLLFKGIHQQQNKINKKKYIKIIIIYKNFSKIQLN